MIFDYLNELAQVCYLKDVRNWVLSPGSRCAALILALTSHSQLRTYTVSDERSAAYMALGMALKEGKTSGLVCTSGTAALNYGPAVAEAFYQQVPLLILTADRPPEWIDQQDGQAIRQQNLYNSHVKKFYQMPVDVSHPDARWHANRIINEAINLSQSYPAGPVHINVPIREPFYPENNESYRPEDTNPRVIAEQQANCSFEFTNQMVDIWQRSRKLVVIGQQHTFEAVGGHQLTDQKIPVVADLISNSRCPDSITAHDIFLKKDNNRLAPDLLITWGKSIISKPVKLFLRKYKPSHYWHIQPAGEVADVYQSLTNVVRCSSEAFIEAAISVSEKPSAKQAAFYKLWQEQNKQAKQHLNHYYNQKRLPFTEAEALLAVLDAMPSDVMLHLSNSMTVRYANLWSGEHKKVFVNRGTSGIDGSSSTAIGMAINNDEPVWLLTGDMAFFYDRNAFWHNYLQKGKNVKIIVFNNHGGGIFNMINGPAQQPQAAEYFITHQRLNVDSLATEYNITSMKADRKKDLDLCLHVLGKTSGPLIIEVVTDLQKNTDIYKGMLASF